MEMKSDVICYVNYLSVNDSAFFFVEKKKKR